jgi:nucleotide-binding universal stress UspA family protein
MSQKGRQHIMLTKPKIERILFATDFFGSSRLALDYAVAFARHFRATIIMVHALELSYPAREAETETFRPSLTRRHAQERLQAVADGVRCAGVPVENFVEEGIPVEVILRAVEYHAADLLVLGVHGVHRGLAHLLIGSNTEKILLSTSCPTMTVGAHVLTGVDPGLHFKEILYFSDFTPEATEAAPYAAFLGTEFQTSVDVCQLLPDVTPDSLGLRQILAEEYCDAIRQAYSDSDSDWGTPAFHLDRGMEFDEIIDRAQSHHAGLIVLGAHTESQLGRHLHTSFAYQLLSKATCPVISIRPRAARSS